MYLRSYTRIVREGKKKGKKKKIERRTIGDKRNELRYKRESSSFFFRFRSGKDCRASLLMRASSKREKAEIGDSGGLGRRITNNRMKSERVLHEPSLSHRNLRASSRQRPYSLRALIPLIPGQPITAAETVIATTATETDGE